MHICNFNHSIRDFSRRYNVIPTYLSCFLIDTKCIEGLIWYFNENGDCVSKEGLFWSQCYSIYDIRNYNSQFELQIACYRSNLRENKTFDTAFSSCIFDTKSNNRLVGNVMFSIPHLYYRNILYLISKINYHSYSLEETTF